MHPPIGGHGPAPRQGAGLKSLPPICFIQTVSIAPTASPVFLDSGHTCVSCPHPNQPCRHNILLPKNDSPSTASSSSTETGWTTALTSDLSISQATAISTTSVVSLPPDGHDRVAHSAQPPHILQIHISLEFLTHMLLVSYLSIFGIGTSEPKQYDTDNAIWNVITYEICSLLPPYISDVAATTQCKDSSGRPLRPFPCGTGLASPYYPTRRVGGSTSYQKVCLSEEGSPVINRNRLFAEGYLLTAFL